MTSTISWLDASPDEAKRVREIIQLFSQRETQDELGGRRIVIALSDALFPGTSVLHTRARYLLFIPWLAERAARAKDPLASFDWHERQMIKSFLQDAALDDVDRKVGLIGREAGPRVKQLPSSAYWSALTEWRVLQEPGTIAETLARLAERRSSRAADDADELAERSRPVWHHGVGACPAGFPETDLDGGFRLKPHEARWLQERWLATCEGSLLAHLAASDGRLGEAWAPWADPACRNAPGEVVEVIDEAERFSLTMAGARLLYYLMVGALYVERGFDAVEIDSDRLHEAIEGWRTRVTKSSVLFEGWSSKGFWQQLDAKRPIDPKTKAFFDLWFDRVRSGDVDGIATDPELRASIVERERWLKRGQARLGESKLLAGWLGGLPGEVTYRWGQVSRLVKDVHEGLDADARA